MTKQTNVNELLPCPFCGGKAKIHTWQELGGLKDHIEYGYISCSGNRCGIRTPQYACVTTTSGDKDNQDEIRAIRKWNTRDKSQRNEVIEEVKQEVKNKTSHLSTCRHFFDAVQGTIEALKNKE